VSNPRASLAAERQAGGSLLGNRAKQPATAGEKKDHSGDGNFEEILMLKTMMMTGLVGGGSGGYLPWPDNAVLCRLDNL
jgi:hypothetical protein